MLLQALCILGAFACDSGDMSFMLQKSRFAVHHPSWYEPQAHVVPGPVSVYVPNDVLFEAQRLDEDRSQWIEGFIEPKSAQR